MNNNPNNNPIRKAGGTSETPTTPGTPWGTPKWLSVAREAIDETLGPEAWRAMIGAQVEKAKRGDAKALKVVVDLAGITALNQATFVQENHSHNHYHGADALPGPRLTEKPAHSNAGTLGRSRNGDGGNADDPPSRSADDWERDRELRARRSAELIASGRKKS